MDIHSFPICMDNGSCVSGQEECREGYTGEGCSTGKLQLGFDFVTQILTLELTLPSVDRA